MNIDQIFSNWDTTDSYAVLVITLIGFLFGLLIGYLLRSPRVRKLRQALEEANQNVVEARRELGAMKDQMDQKEADIQRINYDLVEMTERVNTLEEDKAKLYKDIFHANQEVEKHQANVRAYQATIDELNNQIAYFEEEQASRPEIPASSEVPAAAQSIVSAEAAVNADLLDETRRRLERFEAKLNQLEAENLALKQQMGALHPTELAQSAKSTAIDSSGLIFEIDDVDEEPPLQVAADKKVLHEKIIVADIEKDDLTKIEGIGPFLQGKLHEMGVYTYAEIASWDDAQVAAVTDRIGYFPGRIEKDDWVGQARKLYELKQTNPTAFATVPPQVDDLKIVEGIGPKIEQLLKDAGIMTWYDLSGASLERLQTILNEAGERYRIHDPGTWAEQALLASEGRWDELNHLQEELKGGRKVD